MRIFLTLFVTFLISADDHVQPKFEGLLSSEVFNLDGGMELFVEKRATCNAGTTPNIFILLLVHWYTSLMAFLNQNLQANGKVMAKESTGMRERIGYMVEKVMPQILAMHVQSYL